MTPFIEEAERLLCLTGAGITPPFTADVLQRLTPAAVELRYDEGVPLLTREEADQIAIGTLAWAESLVAKVQ